MNKIRAPIITVCGHVDHGKTSLLDVIRGSNIQENEAGNITQKISFSIISKENIEQRTGNLLIKSGINLKIPGFLFIDTPGHAAFTNLRKRGGSLADLAILVVSIKEGIKPQTAEVLQILKTYKTPFLIALNKIDSISSWQKHNTELKESIESQTISASEEFQEALLTFQGNLREHGFDSDLYYEVSDFSKKITIVPCSARTGEGIPELLFVLAGLCQKFLKQRLEISEEAKGVILEIKKEKSMDYVEAILYDGHLNVGDEIAIASFGEPIVSKIRALEEIEPLSFKYKGVKSVIAASGIRIHLANKEGVLPGMLFQKLNNNLAELKKAFKKEVSGALDLDKQGIIVKADSLGSLDALMRLLRQENIRIVKTGIGPIGKGDLISAKANFDIDPLNAIVLGFNVDIEEGINVGAQGVKVLMNDVIYKLIEDLQKWKKNRQGEIEKERMLGLASICKMEILFEYVFRNSNPAIFGVRVAGGKLKVGQKLIDDKGDEVARVKSLQHEKESVSEAKEGQELAMSLPGVNFQRRLMGVKYLYSEISARQFKEFKKNKDLLSFSELKILQEIAVIKRRTEEGWGI